MLITESQLLKLVDRFIKAECGGELRKVRSTKYSGIYWINNNDRSLFTLSKDDTLWIYYKIFDGVKDIFNLESKQVNDIFKEWVPHELKIKPKGIGRIGYTPHVHTWEQRKID